MVTLLPYCNMVLSGAQVTLCRLWHVPSFQVYWVPPISRTYANRCTVCAKLPQGVCLMPRRTGVLFNKHSQISGVPGTSLDS